MFYSTDCDHCEAMLPVINDLLQAEGIEIELVEVSPKDKESVAFYESYDNGDCGGVPFFVNTESKASLCGAVSRADLRSWALGEQS